MKSAGASMTVVVGARVTLFAGAVRVTVTSVFVMAVDCGKLVRAVWKTQEKPTDIYSYKVGL